MIVFVMVFMKGYLVWVLRKNFWDMVGWLFY